MAYAGRRDNIFQPIAFRKTVYHYACCRCHDFVFDGTRNDCQRCGVPYGESNEWTMKLHFGTHINYIALHSGLGKNRLGDCLYKTTRLEKRQQRVDENELINNGGKTHRIVKENGFFQIYLCDLIPWEIRRYLLRLLCIIATSRIVIESSDFTKRYRVTNEAYEYDTHIADIENEVLNEMMQNAGFK